MAEKSDKNLPRNDSSMGKRGSVDNDTHAAHILPYEVFNETQKHKPGPAITNKERQKEIQKAINDSSNLRIKSSHGNLVTDRKNDAKIIDSMRTEEPLQTQGAIKRAVQQYNVAKNSVNDSLQKAGEMIGDLKVEQNKPGPKPSVASISKKMSKPSSLQTPPSKIPPQPTITKISSSPRIFSQMSPTCSVLKTTPVHIPTSIFNSSSRPSFNSSSNSSIFNSNSRPSIPRSSFSSYSGGRR